MYTQRYTHIYIYIYIDIYVIYIYTVELKITSLFFRGHFWVKFWDSRHSEQSKYTVFDEESEFQVKNKQILEPGGKK